ncbi:type III secretion system (T3SS) SseB-like protein [Microterricola gilva]|uniref:Type III secretion system (T3SS) SseB-like protein n=2 Tax=Microterricola gilva TaxID=393267 RepID=A0A4Q8AID6_9MICO|nr:type III secretion system (T3SS) SseB-like protein [Microterricola gilva]
MIPEMTAPVHGAVNAYDCEGATTERGTMNSARPATVLERAIARAQAGTLSAPTVLWTLAASELIIINRDAVDDGAMPSDPVLLHDDKGTFLALFSHRELAAAYLTDGHAAVAIAGLQLLRRLPDGVGIVMNPGSRLGFEVPGDGVQAFVADLMGDVSGS